MILFWETKTESSCKSIKIIRTFSYHLIMFLNKRKEKISLQMLHDLTKGDGCATVKRGRNNNGIMPETCSTAEV